MPLNKLENFIKNTDGRTLYVNPNDLNATDSISNQGTSLTEPFRTIQRALIESARFSYVRGDDNDLVERTTIVIYPGEHPIDNRPGYGIRTNVQGQVVAVSPSGEEVDPTSIFNLTADTNFDIDSPNNILWHFNSIYGGVIVPRGTSIVGMDLRKTKIRPKYVPNPTDPSVPNSAIFRITGTCYFWQFTIFDGLDTGTVYTDKEDFSENNRSVPTFSHHKLTAFEYADGVNPAIANGFEQTDLAMYYSKLSNAYNDSSGRPIDEKYPTDPEGFAPMRPEFEIVGAFATDPIRISRLISGDGFTPDAVVTVDTADPHGLDVGTPIKIRGVLIDDYNISTKVAAVLSPTRFTYSLPIVRPNLPAEPNVSSATVTVETDTVTGASPYIFNVSMRSVWGINGMLADGSKADGFRSMVVAQFTAISLQKDDRAFVKYNKENRRYDSITITLAKGGALSAQSSSTNTAEVYHLDPEAIYRPGWGTTHIKMSNDAVIQIVSVFAIGFNQHFGALSGADASITNSNSNFGQFALAARGFKNDAFSKDDQGFITQIITPKNAFNPDTSTDEIIDWINIDFDLTRTVGFANQLYLDGFRNKEDRPPFVSQGFRIGAKYDELLFQPTNTGGTNLLNAQIRMVDNLIAGAVNQAQGSSVARKVYEVLSGPNDDVLTFGIHELLNGEKIRIFSDDGDLPENIDRGVLYYANVIDNQNIRISTSESNALNDIFLNIDGGTNLRVESRVNDKEAGDLGHPLQYDEVNGNWFVHTNNNSSIWQFIVANPTANVGEDFATYFTRKPDNRALDDKLYRLRYVIPKETVNSKPPTAGYVLQDSSSTGARNNDDFILQNISFGDYDYDRNPRYIVDCTVIGNEIEVRTEKPHQLDVGDKVQILNVESTHNPTAVDGRSFNGEFLVTRVGGQGSDLRNSRIFRYSTTDVNGFTRSFSPNPPEFPFPDTFSNDTNQRNVLLPRFQRKDNQINAFIYRVEEIVPFTELVRDGIYHLFVVNASNQVTETFTDRFYGQPIEDLYPQLDIDNLRNNPPSTTTFANRSPLGKTTIDEQQNSITRETLDKLIRSQNLGTVSSVTPVTSTTCRVEFERDHFFNGLYSFTTIFGGGGYVDGIYYNVRLLSNVGSTWKGATGKVTVVGNIVTDVEIMDPGSGYLAGETIDIDPATLGGGAGAQITITNEDIEDNALSIIQFTGSGAYVPELYTLIDRVINDTVVDLKCEASQVTPGTFAYTCDSATTVSTYVFDAGTGESTFTSLGNAGFGLQRGNSFVAFDADGSYLGKFYVSANPSPTEMVSTTEVDLTGVAYIGKAGLEDNDAPTGAVGENIGVRGAAQFGYGTFFLETDSGTGSNIEVRAKDGGVNGSVADKLFLGRYIQVGAEIMRVSSSTVAGPSQNIVSVIRGALGTNITNHPQNSKVRAIDPLAIELRRPSILRASGHTFEYLGYGPGNYSTSLPQLQVRQLPDEEVFLVQSQETEAGQVVYTGMSDNGDFYIGNTKYSATSGSQTTFDVPIPTVAGQQASSNSVVFDEVIINQRLFVAGGETNEVLSQFDGPVRFTNNVTSQSRLTVNGTSSLNDVIINNVTNTTDVTNGALAVRGGVGIASDLRIGGDTYFTGDINITGDINLDEGATLFLNKIDATNPNRDVELFYNQTNPSFPLGIGTATGKVIFNTTIPGTGEGGEDDIQNSDGGVIIEGSLVVREKVIAQEFVGDGLGKPGSIIMWGGSEANIPDGYLLCNGSSIPKPSSAFPGNPDTYRKLWAAIGGIHGETADQFNVPDLRGQFIVGAAGAYAVADTGGANDVTLNEDQLGAHTHVTDVVDLSHSHTNSLVINNATANHSHPGSTTSANSGSHVHSDVSTSGVGNHSHGYARSAINNAGVSGAQPINQQCNRNQQGASTNGAGAHSHTVTFNSATGDHNHDLDISFANADHTHTFDLSIESTPLFHSHSVSPSGSTPGTGDAEPHENRPPFYALCYIIQFK